MNKANRGVRERREFYISTDEQRRNEWLVSRNYIAGLSRESAKSFHLGFHLFWLSIANLRLYLYRQAMSYVDLNYPLVLRLLKVRNPCRPPNSE